MNMKGLWDGAYGLAPLSEKTSKSFHLQMSLQRLYFLRSYLKTLSVGLAEVFEPVTSHTVAQYSTSWANQSAGKAKVLRGYKHNQPPISIRKGKQNTGGTSEIMGRFGKWGASKIHPNL